MDERGVAASGAVSFVDLTGPQEVAQVPTDLHPCDLELSPDGQTLYVANANSDTVSVIDVPTARVRETILTRPLPNLPWGSSPNALALSRDGRKLYVANGGNNAIAVIALPAGTQTNSHVQGFIPTYWYPGALVAGEQHLYIADVKGISVGPGGTHGNRGRGEKIPIPTAAALVAHTDRALANARIPEVQEAHVPGERGQWPQPVPAALGEPSLFQHVLYIIKENKTYDALFGDIPRGNGDSNLCLYPQWVTPNHHALATEFVLLDNFYCNGVGSLDGHAWATQGNNTQFIEKSFAGFTRGAVSQVDPLTVSPTGYIWNHVLEHGWTFRNFGELCTSSPLPTQSTWQEVYEDYTNRAGRIGFGLNTASQQLRAYTSTNVPGWGMKIPDQVRADGFLQELNAAQTNGHWPAFTILALPNDHTAAASPGYPTPQAMVADNDLALGRVVEAVSKSPFWNNTVIFVIQDDPQDGSDHVDGHRSPCLVISPYTRRGQTVSVFYNQTSVLHTIARIFGFPPMHQVDAMSTVMSECFTNRPNFTPYTALPNNVALDTMNPGSSAAEPMSSRQRYWARKSQQLDFSQVDRAKEDVLNRAIWFSIKGEARYPREQTGAHGKGLRKLGLKLIPTEPDDD